MLKALKAAFFLRYPITGLGAVPINLIGLTGLALLGLGNHGFWFAGAGLETLYLATLASSPRFQRYVNAVSLTAESDDVEAKRRSVLQQLGAEDQHLVQALHEKCARIASLWQTHDVVMYAGNERALQDLEWAYLKLLVARRHVREGDAGGTETRVAADLQRLERDLTDPGLSGATRESKSATLELLRRRAANFGRRRQSLEEIQSDIDRVEAQVDLALENATLDGKPQTISADLDLASRLLDDSYFGASAADVAALDAAYTASAQPRAKVSE